MAEVPFRQEDDGRIVYDLDAYTAAQADSEVPTFALVKGVEVKLPNSNDIPLEITDWLEAGQATRALQAIFGDQYDSVKEAGLSLGDVRLILALVMGTREEDVLGESEASTG